MMQRVQTGSRWMRRAASLVRHAAVLVAYGLVTCLTTYPLLPRIRTSIAGGMGDSEQQLWIFWWGARSLMNGSWIADVTHSYFPFGCTNSLLGVTPLGLWMPAPLMLLMGPLVGYNVFVMLCFAVSAFTAYVLCFYLTRDRVASFLGGLIYGFCAFRFYHGTGHVTVITSFLFPILLLVLVHFHRMPTWRTAILAGVTIGVTSLVNFLNTAQVVAPILLVWGIGFIWVRFRGEDRYRHMLQLLVCGVVSVLVLLPFVVPFFAGYAGGTALKATGLIHHSATLIGAVVPVPDHPLCRGLGLSARLADLCGGSAIEDSIFAGFMTLALVAWACRNRWRASRFWVVLAGTGYLLAMGPLLKIASSLPLSVMVDGLHVYFPLPYLLFAKLPVLGLSRTPSRCAQVYLLALSPLVAYGVVALRHHLARVPRIVAVGLLALVGGLMVFEQLGEWPYPTEAVTIPTVFTSPEFCRDTRAVLDYPIAEFSNRASLYQVYHGRPASGGRAWRQMPIFYTVRAFMNSILGAPPADPILKTWRGADDRARRAALAHMGFGHVVLHRKGQLSISSCERDAAALAADERLLNHLFGPPDYADADIEVYEVASGSVPDLSPLVAWGQGFFDVETSKAEVSQRWMSDQGQLMVYSFGVADIRLNMHLTPFYCSRSVALMVNGREQARLAVSEAGAYHVTLQPQPGLNEVRLVSSADRPIDVWPHSRDGRNLSVSVRHIEADLVSKGRL